MRGISRAAGCPARINPSRAIGTQRYATVSTPSAVGSDSGHQRHNDQEDRALALANQVAHKQRQQHGNDAGNQTVDQLLNANDELSLRELQAKRNADHLRNETANKNQSQCDRHVGDRIQRSTRGAFLNKLRAASSIQT